jgi:hypothetical protein
MNSIVSKRSPSQIFYKREVVGTLHFLTKDLFILYKIILHTQTSYIGIRELKIIWILEYSFRGQQ